MARIAISDYLLRVKAVPRVTFDLVKKHPELLINERSAAEDDFVISWGDPARKHRYAVTETGFFWDGMHLDTRGIYQLSSLNTAEGVATFMDFQAPEGQTAREIVLEGSLPPSKYRQTRYDIEWPGVVLAAQNPGDRSIHRVASTADYWKFFENACKFYGKDLLVKLHPWNSGEIGERMVKIAKEYGCRAEKTNHKCLESCEFCLVYNSTFAVDCFLRGVPVAQYAPGYFYQTGAVKYLAGEFTSKFGRLSGTPFHKKRDMQECVRLGHQLADFLIHRYCYAMTMPEEKWIRFLQHVESSRDLFPVTDEFSYASNIGQG